MTDKKLVYLKMIDGSEIIGEYTNQFLGGFVRINWPLFIEREGRYTGLNNLIPMQFDDHLHLRENSIMICNDIKSQSIIKLFEKSKNEVFLKVLEQDVSLYRELEENDKEQENEVYQ